MSQTKNYTSNNKNKYADKENSTKTITPVKEDQKNEN